MTVNLSDNKSKIKNPHIFYLLILCVLIFFAVQSYVPLWDIDSKGMDIYFIYLDSLSISEGENPYSRIHESDMIHNQKYTTYFPMFFVLGSGVIKVGFVDFDRWVSLFKKIFLLCVLCIAIIIFWFFYQCGRAWIGIFAVAFWLFNRWTMYVVFVGQIEFFAMIPFIISLLIIKKRPKTAMILFSLSLSIKHIAIFLFPLYVYWTSLSAINLKKEYKQNEKNDIIKQFIIMTILGLSVVGGISIPFLADDAMGLIKSIFFSVTREGIDQTPGMNYVIFQYGLRGRMLLLLMVLGIYILSILKKITIYESAAFCLLIFLGLNPVFFPQYVVWIIPIAFFALGNSGKTRTHTETHGLI